MTKFWPAVACISGLVGSALMAVTAPVGAAEPLQLVSVSSGTQGNHDSFRASVSRNGRYVVFDSRAGNFVQGPPAGGPSRVFVKDLETGAVDEASLSDVEEWGTGNAASILPVISDEGRYVAFSSQASNLVAGDTNNSSDIFVRDRQAGTTVRVSIASDGTQAAGPSQGARISGDGRRVLFHSTAANLVAGDTNGVADLFVHHLDTGATERVSVAAGGSESNGASGQSSGYDLSGNGQYVLFHTFASNIVSGDTNGGGDLFVRDLPTGNVTRVTTATNGGEAEATPESQRPSISFDGRYVAFQSRASNLVSGDTFVGEDTFVVDQQTGVTDRASLSTGEAQQDYAGDGWPSISDDGRFVAFRSLATTLVTGHTGIYYDVFLRDRQAGTTSLISSSEGAAGGNADSWYPDISGDGTRLVFSSGSSNLVSGDINGFIDVFTAHVQPASLDTTDPVLDMSPDMTVDATSPDGAVVAYQVTATDDTDPDPAVTCSPASGTTFALGLTTVACEATDSAGNSATGTFAVTVADTTAPQVSLTAPSDGATVSGTVTLTASATDAVGVAGIRFQVEGVNVGGEDTTAPYTVAWDSENSGAGSHTLTAIARDAAGNTRTSTAVTVTVDPGLVSDDDLVWNATNFNGLYASAPGGTPTLLFSGDAHGPSWSPDRTKVAFGSNRDGNPDIWVLEVASGALTNLTRTDTGVNVHPAWSPDGSQIAFSSNRDGDYDIYTIGTDGAGLRQVTTNTSAHDWEPAWAPDGLRLVYTDAAAQRILTNGRNGGNPVTVLSDLGPLVGGPAWSPDGTRIAFHDGQGFANMGIYTVRPDGSDLRQLSASLAHTDTDPTWSPDGTAIAFTSQRSGGHAIWAIRLDGTGLTNVSQPFGGLYPDWGQNPAPTVGDTQAPELTLPGPLTREATAQSGAVVTYIATATDDTDPDPSVECAPPTGSTFPIGTTTVSCTATDEAGNQATEEFTVTVRDTTAPTVTLTNPANGASVSGTVTLTASATDTVGVTRVQFQVDGSDVGEPDTSAPYSSTWDTTTFSAGTHTLVAVATDAAGNTTTSTVVVTVNAPASSSNEIVWQTSSGSLLMVGAPGSTPRRILQGGQNFYPSWSPDRTRVAFSTNRDGNWDIWFLNLATGALSNVTRTPSGINERPAWSPDGSRIAFSSNRDGDYEIFTIRVDGTGLQQVTRNSPWLDTAPAWSPDGGQLAFTRFGNDSALMVAAADGSSSATVASFPTGQLGSKLSWSPDNALITFSRGGGSFGGAAIFTIRTNGTDLRELSANRAHTDTDPTWSPDGTAIAFSSRRSGRYEIWAMRPDGTEVVNVSQGEGQYPDWGQTKLAGTPTVDACPDYGIPGICRITIDLTNPNPGPMPGGTITITTGSGTSGVTLSPTSVSDPATCKATGAAISCSITRVPAGGTSFTVDVVPNSTVGIWRPQVTWTCGCTTSPPVVVTPPPMTAASHCVKGQVLFDSDSQPPLLDVFAATLDGDVQELSASSGNEEAGAVWSPDRTKFAMSIGVPGRRRLVVVNLNAAGCIVSQAVIGNQPAGDNYQPDWAPDGQRLAFVSNNAGNHDIWSIRTNGAQLTRLTSNPGDDRAPSFSADGSLVAFTSNRTTATGNDWNIWTVQTGGQRQQRILTTAAPGYNPGGADYSPSFSRRAGTSTILWHTDSGGNWDLWLMNADGTNKRRVPNSTAMAEKNADWALGDTRIVYDASDTNDGPADIWMMDANGINRHVIAATPGDDKAPSL